MILVSAGYDAHWRDPLAGLTYRTGTYHRLSARQGVAVNHITRGV